ncbi:MAG: hypothetical protein EB084_23820, partial [Proteobacteria bacterium]|nr:hypothetical protein [Pseudomonadota bacterium]
PDDLVGQMVLLQAREVLGRGADSTVTPDFGLEADFFALGGHSLLATRFTARLRQALGLNVPVRLVFDHPRLLDLATRLKALLSSGEHGEDLAERLITPLAPGAPRPASFAQQRLWFIDQLEQENGSQAYLMPALLEIEGTLNPAALKRAFDALVQQHASLRTLLIEREAAVWQEEIQPENPVLCIESPTSAERAIDRARATLTQPFRLAEDIPIRAILVPIAPEPMTHAARNGPSTAADAIQSWILGFVLHHTAADGWSFSILLRELSRLYEAACAGGDLAPAAPRLSYADFAAWQRRYLSGPRLAAQLDGWKQTLADAPICTPIATDHPRPPHQSVRGGVHTWRIAADVTFDFERGLRTRGATLYMGLLAAWAHVLQRHGAGDDIVIGSPTANRTHPDLEPIVGMFVNTLPLRIELNDAPTFEQLLAHVRERCVQAWAHQDVPFETIVESLDLPRSLSHPPLVQLMLTLQNNEQANFRLGDLRGQAVDLGQRMAKFDLSLSATQTEPGLVLELEYAADLFEPDTAARMAERLTATIERIAAHLTASGGATHDAALHLHRYDLLTDEERDLLRALNTETRPTPFVDALPLVHQRFEDQAALRPHATAFVFEEQTLTYGALDARANRLARHLIALGVAPDARVALVMDRGFDLIVAILATLKAGGAYVPLDPAWPSERITYAIEDSGAKIVLTHEAVYEAALSDTHPDTHVSSRPQIVCIDAMQTQYALARRAHTTPGTSALSPQSLAYVIYTSGSTGRPKGVGIAHAHLRDFISAQAARFTPGETIRATAWT